MAEPSTRHPSITTSRTTTELYRSCMILSEEARSLLVQNEGMKRLGMNAQILAAQTSKQGSGLEVIVSEIGRLSHAIRDVLEALGAAAKSLSSSSIEVLHLSHFNASYKKGFARGIAPGSEDLYKKTHAGVGARGKRHRADLEERLRAVSSLVDDLDRIAQQMPPVTTMIRIVVSEVKSKTVELLGTVDELNSFHKHFAAKGEQMRRIHGVCYRYIMELDEEER